MRIATWNVNSVKARLPLVLRWLEEAKPDVALFQEIKCQTADFPAMEFKAVGYECLVAGQKSYNGVAILSRLPITPVLTALPHDLGEDESPDEQARYIEADIGGVRVATIYLPNGNPVETEKYPYKLRWMERLDARVTQLLADEVPFVLGGDYNICPTDDDVYDPIGWRNDALCRPESRAAFRRIVFQGLTDAFRALHPDRSHAYSFWDYQQGAWARDNGLRIDHLLLSPKMADKLTACDIDRTPRGWEKASDHTPVWCELAVEQDAAQAA